MQHNNEPLIIHMPDKGCSEQVFLLKKFIRNASRVRIVIAPHVNIVIRDSDSVALESLEVIVQQGAHVTWITDSVHKNIGIECFGGSLFRYVQIIGSLRIKTFVQRMLITMRAQEAQSYVRIFPFLKEDSSLKCYTEQIHESSVTSSDVHVIGSVSSIAQFCHTGMITVKPNLSAIQIVQKTIMFLFDKGNSSCANPCFDIASKNVCCTHGAALGAIDEKNASYLQSRGIAGNQAAKILIRHYCLGSLKQDMLPVVWEHVVAMIDANL